MRVPYIPMSVKRRSRSTAEGKVENRSVPPPPPRARLAEAHQIYLPTARSLSSPDPSKRITVLRYIVLRTVPMGYHLISCCRSADKTRGTLNKPIDRPRWNCAFRHLVVETRISSLYAILTPSPITKELREGSYWSE